MDKSESEWTLFTRASETNWGGRSRCEICGEDFQENCASIELFAEPDGIVDLLGDVCPKCAESQEAAALRCREHIQRLEEYIHFLRVAADDLEAGAVKPWATVAELEACERQAKDAMRSQESQEPSPE